ncbi:MAG TPA: hypothetical protein VK473_05010 [Terriglobales bacterium]|nr:hypothetical protein [Terriglobales bacterium]
MKANKRLSSVLLAAAMMLITITGAVQLFAQNGAMNTSPGSNRSNSTQWSVQVDQVDPGDVDLASSFQLAIYESLVDELSKAKQFKQVFRDSDRNANDVPDLLILKTSVQKYTPGSETRRAVTTIAGETKLTVRTQLCTRDGRVILEHVVDGNVRFIGSNLRATHNLARNVAKSIKDSPVPGPSHAVPVQGSQGSAVSKKRAPSVRPHAGALQG